MRYTPRENDCPKVLGTHLDEYIPCNWGLFVSCFFTRESCTISFIYFLIYSSIDKN